MLVSPSISANSIISGKLLSGEEFMAMVIDSTIKELTLQYPLLIGMQNNQELVLDLNGKPVFDPETNALKYTERSEVIFAPFMLSLDNNATITINRAQIVTTGTPSTQAIAQYKSIVASMSNG